MNWKSAIPLPPLLFLVESIYGIAKRRYDLNRIMACFALTRLKEASMQTLVMNVAFLLRLLLSLHAHILSGEGRTEMSLRMTSVAA